MKKQKGAALVVVLSMLAMSLMLGLSGMQSSFIDERLAGNYRASAEAQMNAELGGAEFMSWLQNVGWPEDSSEANAWDGHPILVNRGGRYTLEPEDLEWLPGYAGVSLILRGISGGGAEAYLDVTLSRTPPNMINAFGAYTCFGSDCYVSTGSGQASNSINGKDHLVSEAGCSIKGSNTPEVNPDGSDRAGLVLPSGMLVEGGKGENVVGNPSVVDSEESFDELSYRGDMSLSDAEQELDDFIDWVKSGRKISYNPGEISGLNNVVHAGVGETVEVTGDAGGVIILEGGTLEFKQGNSCFSGIVIAREGFDGSESQVIVPPSIDGKGTTAIVGAVVGRGIDYSGNGTPSVYYSSMALANFAAGSLGDSVTISQWLND